MNADELREAIIRLGPWHLNVQVTPEVSTAAFLDAPAGIYPPELGKTTFLEGQRERWQGMVARIYPDGLQGRSFLDCACNCGAYAFWARELGAGRCFGFDIREHWIRQARFLMEQRTIEPSDDISFDVFDLYELPQRGAGEFDVTLFSGILYHIPDPVTGLKIAADRTRELLIVNTSTRTGLPDGYLAVRDASTEMIMSGVYGLSWYPTGPWVIQEILRWCGFPETRLVWRQDDMMPAEKIGRLEMLAARDASTFAAFDSGRVDDGRDPRDGNELSVKRVPRVSHLLLVGAAVFATTGCGPKSASETPIGQNVQIPKTAPVPAPSGTQSVSDARRRIHNAVTDAGCRPVYALSSLSAPIKRTEWCKFIKTLAKAAVVGEAAYGGQAAVIDYKIKATPSYYLTAALMRDKDGLYHIAYVTGNAGEPVADTTAPPDIVRKSIEDVVDALRKRDCAAFAKVIYTGFGPGASGKQSAICGSLRGSPLPAALAADSALEPKVYGSNMEFAFLGFDTPVGHYTVILSTPPKASSAAGGSQDYEYVDSFLTNSRGSS